MFIDLLKGDLEKLQFISIPKAKLMMVISSTFTDTHLERNILLEKILPNLQKQGHQQNISVIFMDMRYGMKDTNTLDHMTWIACAREIRRCYQESDGLFFISLQGDKYGYMPLPKHINQTIFEKKSEEWDSYTKNLAFSWYILDNNSKPAQYTLKNLISLNDKTYWDETLPVLRQALNDISFDPTYGTSVGKSVTDYELNLALHLNPSGSRIVWMKRHLEVETGEEEEKSNSSKELFCDTSDITIKHKYNNLLQVMYTGIPKTNISEYSLPFHCYLDTESESCLQYIRTWEKEMNERLHNELDRVIRRRRQWRKDGNGIGLPGNILEEMVHHLKITKEKCDGYYERPALIQSCMQIIQSTSGIYATTDSSSPLHAARSSSSTQEAVPPSKPSASGDAGETGDVSAPTDLAGISLCLVGGSGTGKTALVSRLAQICRGSFPDVPVITRYCGTSSHSTDALKLIRSICIQMEFIYGEPCEKYQQEAEGDSNSCFPAVYSHAVLYFQSLLCKYPVILLIDSLDQLSDMYQARSYISFLTGIRPHKKTRIIVSTLPDELGLYMYLCDTRLRESHVPRVYVHMFSSQSPTSLTVGTIQPLPSINAVPRDYSVPSTYNLPHQSPSLVAPSTSYSVEKPVHISSNTSISLINKTLQRLNPISCLYRSNLKKVNIAHDLQCDDARLVLEKILSHYHRTLTTIQWKHVMQSVSLQPSALYLTLAARIISKWRSTDVIEENGKSVMTSVPLASSVSDVIHQIVDSLERDFGKVLTKFALGVITFSVNGVNDTEMQDILSLCDEVLNQVFQYSSPSGVFRLPIHVWIRLRGELEGLLVERSSGCLVWYHRQLREVISKRFSASEKRKIHSILGLYFSDKVPKTIQEERFITRQPLLLTDTRVWFHEAVVNKRHCEEASTHLVAGHLINEAMDELCSFEAICAHILAGYGFQFLRNFITLFSLLDGYVFWRHYTTGFDPRKRFEHYMRWIREDMNLLIQAPRELITESVGLQPQSSIARLDMVQYINTHSCASISSLSSLKHSWWRVRSIGTADVFNALIGTLQGHTQSITSLCVGANDACVISASRDKTIKMWDLETGECTATLHGHVNHITSVCITFNSRRIISGSMDKLIKIWDIDTGSCNQTLVGHWRGVTSVCVSRDDKHIISGSVDNSIKIWDISKSTCIRTFTGHTDKVLSVCISIDNQFIFSASADMSIKRWQFPTGVCDITLIGHTDAVTHICVTPDAYHLISASWDYSIKMWNVSSQECIATFVGHADYVEAVCITPNGREILSASWDKTVKIWDIKTSTLIATLDGHSHSVFAVCCTLDRSRIISGSSGYVDASIKIYDMNMREVITSKSHHQNRVTAVCITSDNNWIISGSWDNQVKIWDIHTEKCVMTILAHEEGILFVLLTHDDSKIITCSYDTTMNLWNRKTGQYQATFTGHTSAVSCAAVNKTNNLLVSGSFDMTLRVWDMSTQECICVFEEHTKGLYSLCISDNDRIIYAGCKDALIYVWDIANKQCVNQLHGHTQTVNSLVYMIRKKQVVSSSSDGSIKIWEEHTNNCISTLIGHTDRIFSIAVTSDESCLISVAGDRTMKIWNLDTCVCIHTMAVYGERIFCISISSNDMSLVTGSLDSYVRIWNVEIEDNRSEGKSYTSSKRVNKEIDYDNVLT